MSAHSNHQWAKWCLLLDDVPQSKAYRKKNEHHRSVVFTSHVTAPGIAELAQQPEYEPDNKGIRARSLAQ